MSRKSKYRKIADPRRDELWRNYNKRYYDWLNRAPSRLHIFKRWKWEAERPHKPKWMDEYEKLCHEYPWYRYG